MGPRREGGEHHGTVMPTPAPHRLGCDGISGSRLQTVATFILSRVENGTRLRVVHSGFVLPNNATSFGNLSQGWKQVSARSAPCQAGASTDRAH